MLRRLDALRGHLAAAPVAAEEEEDEEPPILAALQAAGLDGEPLEKVSWEEIMAHNTPNDLWVVVDGAVFDMTDFITTDHPGGEEIPAEYGGKDASEFWNDIHGHLKEEILEDVATGEGEWTGLDILPRIVGLADGPPPLAAQGRPQPLLWQQKNWSGFVQWSHGHGEAMLTPSTVEEVQEIVRSNNQVRVLGRGHGFPAICDQSHAEGVMVSLLPNMGRILEIDTERSVAVVEGGCVYRALVEQLEGTGLALQNTQSLSHITVAGGVATGSHGSSGVDPTTGRARLPSTATLISGLEIVIGDGSVVEYSRDRDTEIWGGLVTSLGCHGVVTKLTIDLVPDFDVHSFGYQGVSAETFLEHWDDMLNHPSCTSFNAMLRWPCDEVGFGFQHFIPAGERALGPSEAPPVPETWYGEGAPRERAGWVNNNIVRWHQSVIGMSPKGIPEEFQLEFFVPLEHAVAALRATWQVAAEHWGEIVEPEDERPADAVGGGPAGGHIMNYHHIRVVRGDDQWLSPTTSGMSGTSGDVLCIAFGMNHATPKARLLEEISRLEAALEPFEPRAHMGKLCTLPPQVWRSRYGERVGQFVDLAHMHDPTGKFSNEYTDHFVFGVSRGDGEEGIEEPAAAERQA